ncbi:MAG: SDR family NAD(P)-dependent oxidoreductase [Actinomycetota bacterium]
MARVDRYDGHVAVVTGASSGLGRRLALDLADRGAAVVGVARSRDALERLADESKGTIDPAACDVSDEAAISTLLADIERQRGSVDVLVNSAGWAEPTKVEQADLDLYHRIFATNFFGLVAATLAVVPGMLHRGRGIVVNVSSDHGRAPAPGTPAYSSSKAAVSAFTESLAHECHGRGVHLHVLYPGWVPTPLGQGAVDAGMPQPPNIVRRTEEQVSAATLRAMGRPGIEINCAPVATLAPVMRALLPPVYRAQMRKQANRG